MSRHEGFRNWLRHKIRLEYNDAQDLDDAGVDAYINTRFTVNNTLDFLAEWAEDHFERKHVRFR